MSYVDPTDRSGISSANFVAPALPVDVMERSALEDRLGPVTCSRLSLVTGPAGAGKTTLTRSWTTGLSGPWAWLTIDNDLGRRERFWPAFVRAVGVAQPAAVLDAADAVSADALDGERVARAVVDDLVAMPDECGPVVVVVDDAHLVDTETWRDLAWVVEHQPPGLHLVLVSRSDPPFSVGRLRSLGRLTEVRQRDLPFSRAETAELVRRRLGPEAAATLGDRLHERTEGWAAGIRLALITIGAGESSETVLTGPDQAHGFVSELLISEALDRLPDDVRSFLVTSSVIDTLEPTICEALSGRVDSRDVLRRLAHDHVFLTALQGRADVYRFHPLFADVLRAELRTGGADSEASQHRLAANWYEDAGDHARAVEHAMAGGFHELAFDLIVTNLAELYGANQRDAVGRWLVEIPDSFIVADPDRAVAHCAALVFVVRREWLRWLLRARSVVGDDRPDLLGRLELFEALKPGGQGDLDAFEEHVARAARLGAGTTDPFDEVIDAWRARLLVLHGRPAEALVVARDIEHRPRRLIRDLPARSLVAAVAHAAGDPTAPELVHDVVAEWRSLGEPDYLGMADALSVAAELACRRGDLGEAELLAAGAVAVSSERPIHLIGIRAQLALAAVETTTGRAAEADRRRRELRALITGRVDRAVLALFDDSPGCAAERAPVSSSHVREPLTARERVILDHLAGHRTYPEIGQALYISRHTVKTHVSRIYRKLGVDGRSAAIDAATTLGLLDG